MESHLRSIFKALSWRASGTVVTFLIAWLILGQVQDAVKIGAFDTLMKIGVFYFHERLWNRLQFGKLKPPDYQI
ncbi:MAG TPA: DUF2061 domain-containing protein [Anaerohalosphaeraceae bacterium]|jgi:uncharacterized membrane protein|nr:DUF2061 domain-containing protein [Anaerohalosphaeraceae bacterium]